MTAGKTEAGLSGPEGLGPEGGARAVAPPPVHAPVSSPAAPMPAPEMPAPEMAGRGHRLPARPHPRFGIWLLLSLPLLVLALGFAFLVLSRQPIAAPGWTLARLEARANAALGGRGQLRLGAADLVVEEGFTPRIRLRQVQIFQPTGLALAVFPELSVSLRGQPLLRGKLEPKSLFLRGASVSLRRFADGRLDVDLGGSGQATGLAPLGGKTPAEMSAAVKALFATPLLARVETISAEDLRLRLDDARLGRVWEVSQGQFRLTQDASRISLTVALDVGERNRLPAQVALTAFTEKGSLRAELGVAVTDVPAADLAVQTPALALLGVLDAPISGTLRTRLEANGTLGLLEARLGIGAGALQPEPGARPLAFDSADLHLSYDPSRAAVTLSRLDLQSPALRLGASGQVLMRDFVQGLPQEALVQLALSDIQADPEGLFERPARISQGALDLRLRLAPFRMELGQLQLVEGRQRISGRGQVAAGPQGWSLSLDAGVGAIASKDLLALWPKALVPKTRDWLAHNISTGELRNVHAALRLAPGAEPRVELGYEFRGAEVRVLPTLPVVQNGRGFAGITGRSHTLMVEEGRVTAPSGGQIEVADSVMIVPDIRENIPRTEVRLVTRAPIAAALSLLDQKPFQFLAKAGRGTDLAEGWAEARTTLGFLLKKELPPDEVEFDVQARLSDVRSTVLVPGHSLVAPRLRLRADRAGMTISGGGQFDGIPFDGRWSQVFGPEHRGQSRLEGFVEITPKALETLKIALPKGTLGGEGWGHLALDLRKDQPPAFTFQTDLKGLSLAIPALGWAKPGRAKGHLQLAGHLGTVPSVERLSGQAEGLEVEGKLRLSEQGFAGAELSRLVLGRWFEGAVRLENRGKGRAPDVAVTAGRLDLRHLPQSKAVQGGGGKISARLTELVVSDGLALAPLSGEFSTVAGLSGAFRGRVNGGAEVEGAVGPDGGGRTAVRISAANAGAVLASAGLFSKAQGGRLDLTLSPFAQKSYDGRLSIRDLRVKDAPVLASMLSAASIIGLLEQLNGDGILFTELNSAFRLTPEGVSVTNGEAFGASMGVTMTGNYYPASKVMDMQGVVTPFYLVNAIGQIFTRPGEGLFGFTYSFGGTAQAPKLTINPLSIFTPGMFRDMFRRAPPPLVTE